MNNQNGKISGSAMALIAIMVFGVMLFFSYYSAHNRANAFENNIKKAYQNSQLELSSCTTKIRNISKIPDEYASQLNELVQAEMNGRYGGQSTNRVALFVQESSKDFDASMLKNIQNEISACEVGFKQKQQITVDMINDYEKALGTFWGGKMMAFADYPKNDMSQYKMVLDNSSRKQFETGVREDYELGFEKKYEKK